MSTSNAPKPWVKLWRVEEGSFAQLPLYCRAIAAEILKIADSEGRIGLGGKDPADAVAFALGADRGDRRLLRKHLPMLLEDGYLEHVGDDLIVVGWTRWQTEEGPPKRPRRSNEPTTTEQRTDHDRATTVPRRSNETPPKSAESHARNRQEKRREEGEKRSIPAPPLPDSSSEGARATGPTGGERWLGHDLLDAVGEALRTRRKRIEDPPGIQPQRMRDVVALLGDVDRDQALRWCREWATDPSTERFSLASLRVYVAARLNGRRGWARSQAMRKVATEQDHRDGAAVFRALGIHVIEAEAAE